MKTHLAYKCSSGHVNRLDFKEHEFKLACPTCGETIYRYRDGTDLPPGMENEEESLIPGTTKKKVPLKNSIMAIGLVVCFFGGYGALMTYKPTVQAIVKLAAMPKRDTTAEAKPAAPEKPATDNQPASVSADSARNDLTGVRNIEIANLKADVEGKGKNATAHIRLKLINHGDPNTPYPDLRLKWRGSTAKDIVIASAQYAHPNGLFTELDIETELHKPPHAKGVDIDLNESK